MTTIPASPSQALGAAARHASPSGGGASTAPAAMVDPVKLLQKYKWVLLASLVVGAVLGAAAHYTLMRMYPRWRPYALFLVEPPVATVEDLRKSLLNVDEMNRFMQTQARIMRSEDILGKAVEDPTIQREAAKWCQQFVKKDPATGQDRFSTVDAARELGDDIEARVIPQTNLIQLAFPYKHREDATFIVRLVREKYQEQLREAGRRRFTETVDAVTSQVRAVENELRTLQTRRENLIRDKGLDDIQSRQGATAVELSQLNQDFLEVRSSLAQVRETVNQLEKEKNSPAGPQVGDDLKSEAEEDPVVREARARMNQIAAQMEAMINRGVGRDHRDYKQLESQLAGEKSNMDVKLKEVLQKLFDGDLDRRRKAKERLEVQEAEMASKVEQLKVRMVELNNAAEQVEDFKRQIDALVEQRNTLQKQLQNVNAVTLLDSANRVTLQQAERLPSLPDFPKLKVLVPAGMIATLGLVALGLFVRELIDQRVKGPSDITIIPRTRLLGFVPDAAEDPAGQGAAETAFRDRSKGVVAESFRQLRGAVIKRVQQADHRTILVMSGMPGSGATSVVCNLAHAFAAADRKVLIIDANFRRPSMHRVLGLPETPGLADALAQGRELKGFVQATATPNLDLMPAGSREQRVYERLSTQTMAELLAKARASYDIVLVDVAPAIVSGDGMSLAQKCDASVLVVRALAEKRGMVVRVKNELSDARAEFLGVVVNAVKHAAGGYLKGNIKAATNYQDK
jgi:polysaccharide biosynthesis transport protein